MTAINAYDGKNDWKIEPWNGKKDPESLGEEELKAILEDADFDGPLVNYKQKANKVEFSGMDQFEGTNIYLGETGGRGRIDQHHEAHGRAEIDLRFTAGPRRAPATHTRLPPRECLVGTVRVNM